MEEYRGFYYDGYGGIYADITNKILDIFGEGLIKKALYELSRYYENLDNECLNYKEYIDKHLDVLVFDLEHNVRDANTEYLDIDGITIIVEFVNDFTLSFNTSEWGRIEKINRIK